MILVDSVGIRDGGGTRLFELLLQYLCACRSNWRWLFYVLPQNQFNFGPVNLPNNAEIVEVHTVRGWFGRYHWLNRQLPAIALRHKADILFSFANLLPVRPPVPTVLFLQQPKVLDPLGNVNWRESIRMSLLSRYLKATAGAACKIVVQSEQMKMLMAKQIPHVANRIDVIQSPVLVNHGKTRPEVTSALNAATHPRIAYVSLPRSHKNHINLVRAFAHVRQELPSASLLLTVPAPSIVTTEPTIASIHAEACDLGIVDAITWLGLLSQDEVAAVYNSADAMIFPSLKESFGMPLAEAVCARRPVIASDLPFAHEILGDAGAYFNPLQPSDIANVTVETLRKPGRIEAMRVAAEKRCGRFAPDHVAEQLCALFERVITETRTT